MGGVLELSCLIIMLGAKGFTRTGLPFSSKTNIAGTKGKVIGAACIALGLSGVVFAYWASDPPTRARLATLGQGIIVGVLGSFGLFMWGRQGDD